MPAATQNTRQGERYKRRGCWDERGEVRKLERGKRREREIVPPKVLAEPDCSAGRPLASKGEVVGVLCLPNSIVESG